MKKGAPDGEDPLERLICLAGFVWWPQRKWRVYLINVPVPARTDLAGERLGLWRRRMLDWTRDAQNSCAFSPTWAVQERVWQMLGEYLLFFSSSCWTFYSFVVQRQFIFLIPWSCLCYSVPLNNLDFTANLFRFLSIWESNLWSRSELSVIHAISSDCAALDIAYQKRSKGLYIHIGIPSSNTFLLFHTAPSLAQRPRSCQTPEYMQKSKRQFPAAYQLNTPDQVRITGL